MKLSGKSLTIGLGLGIILTATFLMFLPLESMVNQNTLLTDQDIIEKSKELGMVDPKDLAPERFILSEDEIIRRAEQLGMKFEEQTTDKLNKIQEDKSNNKEKLDTVTVYIPKGFKSKQISTLLFDNNLVDSVEKFDFYLRQNNVDRSLADGYFDIPTNSDYETLMNILIKPK